MLQPPVICDEILIFFLARVGCTSWSRRYLTAVFCWSTLWTNPYILDCQWVHFINPYLYSGTNPCGDGRVCDQNLGFCSLSFQNMWLDLNKHALTLQNLAFIFHINKPEFTCFNARALLQGSLVFLLTCLIFRQKISVATGPGTILVQSDAHGRFLGLHLPWSSVLMPLVELWTFYLYSSVKSCRAALHFGGSCPGRSVNV